MAALIRHLVPELAENDAAGRLDLDDAAQRGTIDALIDRFVSLVQRADKVEGDDTRERVRVLLNEWDRRARNARESGSQLLYDRQKQADAALFKRFGQSGELARRRLHAVIEPNVRMYASL
jgi:hypothetical protein